MSTLIQKDSNIFYHDVLSWLEGAARHSVLSTVSDLAWPTVLRVDTVGKRSLEIALISIREWVEQSDSQVLLDKYYQAQRRLREEGVNSIILWEDVWVSKRNIVESRILSLIHLSQTIPARLTKVRRIDKSLAGQFLTSNHLQGATSSKYRYGLFLPSKYFRVLPDGFSAYDRYAADILVAAATFSAPRIFPRGEYAHRSFELIRFANLLNITVVGGFDKLLSHFIAEIKPDDIMTYADSDWSDGESYKALGFAYVSEKDPMSINLDMDTLVRSSDNKKNENGRNITIQNAGSRKFVRLVKSESSF